jgi:hypothetical protein
MWLHAASLALTRGRAHTSIARPHSFERASEVWLELRAVLP